MSVDEKISEINKELKDLKADKKEAETEIISKMLEEEHEILGLRSGGKLKLYKSTTRGALKHELIEKALKELLKNGQKAEEVAKYILEQRPVVEKVKLKRLKLNENKGKGKGRKK